MSFFKEYLNKVCKYIETVDFALLEQSADLISCANESGGKIIFAGNGASATIASHVSVDLTNCSNVRAINFNEAALITCFSNDFGYERWVEKAVDYYADENDLLVLISSSGRSKNMINCAESSRKQGLKVITFTGFEESNPLKQLGDVNLWVNSSVYNVVEAVHQIWLSVIVDKLSEKRERQ